MPKLLDCGASVLLSFAPLCKDSQTRARAHARTRACSPLGRTTPCRRRQRDVLRRLRAPSVRSRLILSTDGETARERLAPQPRRSADNRVHPSVGASKSQVINSPLNVVMNKSVCWWLCVFQHSSRTPNEAILASTNFSVPK